jgi:membrane protease YdiL (CAAX protease family)
LGSSIIFLLAHFSNGGIAVTQAVGGLVFAFAYEMEKNIIVPVVIHVLGNLALFATGLLPLFF